MFVLRSSKTHNKGSKPQIIKISSCQLKGSGTKWDRCSLNKTLELPCPYALLREYANTRIPYRNENDQFFVFSDGSPVSANNLRKCLKDTLKSAGFDCRLYSVHGLRAGRAGDLIKLGVSLDTIKRIGCWKSNAVFRYFKYS